MRKKSLKNKEGSAMLIAIAIMAVLVMLGLALLRVSFSLHATCLLYTSPSPRDA